MRPGPSGLAKEGSSNIKRKRVTVMDDKRNSSFDQRQGDQELRQDKNQDNEKTAMDKFWDGFRRFLGIEEPTPEQLAAREKIRAEKEAERQAREEARRAAIIEREKQRRLAEEARERERQLAEEKKRQEKEAILAKRAEEERERQRAKEAREAQRRAEIELKEAKKREEKERIEREKEERRQAAEQKRLEEERRRREEKERIEREKEERRQAAEQKRQEEERKRKEERDRIEREKEERRQAAELARLEAAEKKRAEAEAKAEAARQKKLAKQAAKDAKKTSSKKPDAEPEVPKVPAKTPEQIAEEQRLEAEKLEREAEEARIREEERRKEDELIDMARRKLEEERLAEQRRLEEERLITQRSAEEERLAEIKRREIEAKLAEEQKILDERERERARREAERLEQEKERERLLKEAERIKREEEAALEKEKSLEKIKAEKLKEAKRKSEEEKKNFKAAEKERKAKEKAEAKAEKEKKKLQAKRNKGGGKLNKKQAELLRALEASVDSAAPQAPATEEEAIEEVKKKIKKSGKKRGSGNSLFSSSKKYLVVEIGEKDTYLSEIAITGSKNIETKRVTILDYASFQTPDDAFVEGSLANTQKLALELMKTIVDRGIKTKDVIWVSDENSILQRPVADFPLQKDAKSNLEIVFSKAADLFPVDIENYVLRYKILNTYNTDGSRTQDEEKPELSANTDIKNIKGLFGKKKDQFANIQIIAFPQKLQQTYEQLGSTCGLTTKAVDYSNNGMINMLRREYRYNDAVCIEIKENYTTYYVVSNGLTLSQSKTNIGYKNMLNRSLSYGDSLIGSTSNDVWDNISKYGLLEENPDKERLRQDLGLSEDYMLELDDVVEEIRYSIESIIDKARTVIQEAKRLSEDSELERVDIICCEKKFPDITEDFENITGFRPEMKAGYEWLSSIDDSIDVNSIIHSVGASLDPVDFKTSGTKKEKKRNSKVLDRIAMAILILGFLGAIGGTVTTKFLHRNAVKERSSMEVKLTEAHEAELIATQARQSIGTLGQVQEFIDHTTNSDQLYSIMTDLERVTPRNTTIATIISTKDMFSITAYTETRYEAIKLIEGLEGLDKYLKKIETFGIQVADSTNTATSELGNYTLTINCYYIEEDIPVLPPEEEEKK